MHNVPYQKAIGSLMHIAVHSRPDIAYSVQQVSQFSTNPSRPHWKAVKQIIAYLKTTHNVVLTLGSISDTKSADSLFIAYCDADHTNSLDHA